MINSHLLLWKNLYN